MLKAKNGYGQEQLEVMEEAFILQWTLNWRLIMIMTRMVKWENELEQASGALCSKLTGHRFVAS